MKELHEHIPMDRQKSAIHFDNNGDVDDKQSNSKIAIHFDHHNHDHENGTSNNDPVKMLLNQPKRSSLKKSCLIQSRINENQGFEFRS